MDKEEKTAAMHATIYDTETGLNGFCWSWSMSCFGGFVLRPVQSALCNETRPFYSFQPNAHEGSGHCHSSSFFFPIDSLAKRCILLYLNDPTLGQLTKCWSLAGLEASEPPKLMYLTSHWNQSISVFGRAPSNLHCIISAIIRTEPKIIGLNSPIMKFLFHPGPSKFHSQWGMLVVFFVS